MHLKLFAIAFAAAVFVAAPARAAACCDQHAHNTPAACCDKPCCADHRQATEPSIVEMMIENDPQLNPAPPVRQTAGTSVMRPETLRTHAPR